MSDASAILIAGPTASGKSALAVALAEHFGGTVINADSMQVYRELKILSARPTPEDEARVHHALYGFVPASDAYSTGRFVKDAERVLEDAKAKGRRPIFVGGTGLYFKALLEGLSPIPEIDPHVRAHWRAQAERAGPGELYIHLTLRDPEMASRLNPGDSQRIVRALEVLESSGTSLAVWQTKPGRPLIDESTAVKLLVRPPRADLYIRADQRFDAMMAAGALDEARAIAALGLDANLPAMRALGVAPLIRAARGEVPVADAVAQSKADTNHYIKRQETWLKRHMITWKGVYTKEKKSISDEVIAFIQS
jgi:tRNA dimethylallyltransferase